MKYKEMIGFVYAMMLHMPNFTNCNIQIEYANTDTFFLYSQNQAIKFAYDFSVYLMCNYRDDNQQFNDKYISNV